MPDQKPGFSTQRLTGSWEVSSLPLTEDPSPLEVSFTDALAVPECTHLQPFLYPDNPYWGEHLREINNRAWIYRRTFKTPDSAFKRARLLFEGVDYFAEVWLNGQKIGDHEGNFDPFYLEITDVLYESDADNELIVKVTSPWDAPNPKGTYPSDHVIRGLVKGLYEHGEGLIPPNVNPIGIWRPVFLVLDQGLSIDHIRIRTELDGKIDLRLRIANTTDQPWDGNLNLDITADNHDGDGITTSISLCLSPGTQAFDTALKLENPRLWWPYELGEPNLYRLQANLVDQNDTVLNTKEEIFGVRTVHLERTPERFTYIINGRPTFIRGSSYLPGLYLSQCSEETYRRDMALAKDANLNLLRVHVHVSPPELYTLCDREGMLVWQDFELSWIHEATLEFEARALKLQRRMIEMLGNHPSVITWTCHNEPTMVFTRRQNLERHPDPALYADAIQQDPTRPVFICSGQLENDWERSGDSHSYYGAIWTQDYTDVYNLQSRLSSEFGFETPASAETLQTYPYCWERLEHLEGEIESLWDYQAELTLYHVEHFRRLRATCCAGYVQFWLIDLVPQVGCGVLDSRRQPKGGFDALRHASQPVHIALEHDGRKPIALWVFNDTSAQYPQCTVHWSVYGADQTLLFEGQMHYDVAANASQHIISTQWPIDPVKCEELKLTLTDRDGCTLSINTYQHPFRKKQRPAGYPWKFDFELGTKVFDKPGAPSMVDLSGNAFVNLVPRRVRESLAEWMVRQHLPTRVVSSVARILDTFA